MQYVFEGDIKEENGKYFAYDIGTKLTSSGLTSTEALNNLKKVINLWLEETKKQGRLEEYLPRITMKIEYKGKDILVSTIEGYIHYFFTLED